MPRKKPFCVLLKGSEIVTREGWIGIEATSEARARALIQKQIDEDEVSIHDLEGEDSEYQDDLEIIEVELVEEVE